MKIKSVERAVRVVYYVEVEEGEWTEYRRSEGGAWEQRYGDSWEQCDEVEIEKAFQEFLATHRDSAHGISHRVLEAMKRPDEIIRALARQSDQAVPVFENHVYYIEFLDADHIRLIRKETP